MTAGITAGSMSAVVAALVSLPLRSPDDILLNSVSVVAGALLAGVVAGITWRLLTGHPRRTLWFGLIWPVLFGLIALLAVAGETQLDHFLAFMLPLGAIAFSITGVLTVTLERTAAVRRKWLPAAAVIVALALGIGLAGQGDERSGELELPPRAGVFIVVPSQPANQLSIWRI